MLAVGSTSFRRINRECLCISRGSCVTTKNQIDFESVPNKFKMPRCLKVRAYCNVGNVVKNQPTRHDTHTTTQHATCCDAKQTYRRAAMRKLQ